MFSNHSGASNALGPWSEARILVFWWLLQAAIWWNQSIRDPHELHGLSNESQGKTKQSSLVFSINWHTALKSTS